MTSHRTTATPVVDLRSIRADAPAIHVPGYLPATTAAAMADAVAALRLRAYDVTAADPDGAAYFYGANLYDTRPDASGLAAYEPYFAAAARDRVAFTDLLAAAGLPDPLEDLFFPTIARALDADVRLACEPDGRSYYAPVVRSTENGIHHHTDNGPEEAPELVIGSVRRQRSMLLFLATPDDGSGALQVFHKRPTALDRARNEDDAYGFTPAAVEGSGVTTIVPSSGDLVVFDTWNIHRVLPSTPGSRRITVSMFYGETDDSVIAWS